MPPRRLLARAVRASRAWPEAQIGPLGYDRAGADEVQFLFCGPDFAGQGKLDRTAISPWGLDMDFSYAHTPRSGGASRRPAASSVHPLCDRYVELVLGALVTARKS